MASKKTVTAFGGTVERFGQITSHPGLDVTGLYIKRPAACDPCLYHPIPIHKIFEVNKNLTVKDPWRYKIELEEWAKNLGYRNSKIIRYRKYQQSVLGPAWHDVEATCDYEPACKNVGFGRTPRTRPSKASYPPPGIYYKAQPYRAPYGPHSTRPTLDREELCRFKDDCPKWSLAPNRYTIVDKDSIEQKPNKIVSRRGPYDLLTGERFRTKKQLSAATWPIALKGTLDKYNRSLFGTMNKTDRSKPYRGRNALVDVAMCHRGPEEPGPAHYGPPERTFGQNKVGFLSSYDKGPGYKRVVVWPGVGRYSPADVSSVRGHGWTYVFKCKQRRTIGSILPQPYNTF